MLIRLAQIEDIPEVWNISQTWYDPIYQENSADGFLFGEPYTEQELELITKNGDMAVACKNKEIVGFFLLDNSTANKTTLNYIQHLAKIDGISLSGSICPRAQIAIKKEYQNQGISISLTQFLKSKASSRYDLIYSLVSKINPKMEVYTKSGWHLVSETDKAFIVALKVN